MIKKLFIACAAFVWTIALVAQNISVVNSSGSTKLYRTLQAAIEGAAPNSVIYLPGGGFPIADSVKITKKLTIIGIGHYAKSGNVDAVTTISGNLFFKGSNSSGSAVIGCYIAGTVNIGSNVNDVLIRYCNLNGVDVAGPSCQGTIVNQCYVRNISNFHNANGYFTNNIAFRLYFLENGFIENNIFNNNTGSSYDLFGTGSTEETTCHSSSIIGNVIIGSYSKHTKDCQIVGNMLETNWGEDYIKISSSNWANVFENPAGRTPSSNYHFKENYKQYEDQVGIYAGDGFLLLYHTSLPRRLTNRRTLQVSSTSRFA